MSVTRCLHVALLVTDLALSERFYGDILGLSKIERSLTYAGAWYQIGDFQLHLIVDPQFKASPTNPHQWGRNPHVAIGVTSLADAIARLQASGCPVQMSASGRSACFTRDPDGNIIEISQIAPTTF